VLAGLVTGGFLLRAALVAFAENRLDADEATVGVMALDILEGRALPFFFYGQAYNGGGAIEAYLGALFFAAAGASEVALKVALLALWGAAAVLFSRLCRRILDARRALLAVLFFCIGTPFFLEWSVKARGGYAETLFLSILLLWLAVPIDGLKPRLRTQGLCFGLATGLGLWASEMLLLIVPCAGALLVWLRPPHERFRAVIWCTAGFLLGSIPLFVHNATHDWENYGESTLASVVAERAGEPLTLELLQTSANFVLGPRAGVLLACLCIGAARIVRRRPFDVTHALLAHVGLFALAYWVVGTRFLPGVAPARVLYVLLPGFALLFACGVCWRRDAPPLASWLGGGAIAVWGLSVVAACLAWGASGVPREAGSWRAGWALTDGRGLADALRARRVDTVVVDYWTYWPLQFALRAERHREPETPPVNVRMSTQRLEGPGLVAIALRTDTPLFGLVEAALLREGIGFERSPFRDFAILTQIDAGRLRGAVGLPPVMNRGAWKPPPSPPDGFN
jgi:hypothetical protein